MGQLFLPLLKLVLELPDLISQKAGVWPCAGVLSRMGRKQVIQTPKQPPPRYLLVSHHLHLFTTLMHACNNINKPLNKEVFCLSKKSC